ncbi:MAG: DUF4446 family protein [Actinomycetota bacterium]
MALDANALEFIALAGVSFAGASLAVAFRANARLDKVKRTLGVLHGTDGDEPGDRDLAGDIVATVQRLDRENGELFAGVRRCLQNVGLVRFDAFEDMGGRLSFCAAMLDIDGNGLVITSINGRAETRMYAKPVERGVSKYHLSDEEQAAIRRALGDGAPKPTVPKEAAKTKAPKTSEKTSEVATGPMPAIETPRESQ